MRPDHGSTWSYPDEVSEQKPLYWVQKDPYSTIMLGDCIKRLKEIPDASVDFAFADPPYNLNKKYAGYADDLEISSYFEWCDQWITELARVLRPGRTLTLLNMPLWAVRHFLYLEKVLKFQNWVVWDALSYPVRKIMPAHYTVLCFSKGVPRELPGLNFEGEERDSHKLSWMSSSPSPLEPLAEGFCLRTQCVETRKVK